MKSRPGGALSHHGDSLLSLLYPQLGLCDLYVFRGGAGTVLIMTVNPLSGPGGLYPGGFYPGGQYAFHIARTGSGVPDLTLRATFSDGLPDGQYVELRLLGGERAGDRGAAGKVVAAGRSGTLIEGRAGVRLWAGAAADPYWMNDGVLITAQECIATGRPFDPRIGALAPAMNIFAYSNVQALAAEVPPSVLAADEVRVWATTAVPGGRAGWTQVSRGAIPLLTSLFGIGGRHGGPAGDRELYGETVRAGAARAAGAIGSAADPAAHGDLVAAALLPDVLTYRPGTAARFGPGARNGRGLRDPAAETVLSIVMGTHVPLGLDASSATGRLRAVFPYLAAPVAGPPGPFR